MKTGLLSIFAVVCMGVVIVSCTKEGTMPQDSTAFGVTTISRNIIGTNQNIRLACEVSVAKEATDVQIQWQTANGITVEQDSYENGISYCTFTWDTPGDYTVKCKITYIYGSEVKTAEKPLSVTVHRPDFRNAFIGDNMANVLADNPKINEENDYTDEESPALRHKFYFVENIFIRGETIEKKVVANPNPKASYSLLMLEAKKYEKIGSGEIKYSILPSVYIDPDFEPTAEQENVMNKFESGEILTDGERIILGELVDNGTIYLKATIPMKNWQGKDSPIIILCMPLMAVEPTYIIRTVVGALGVA